MVTINDSSIPTAVTMSRLKLGLFPQEESLNSILAEIERDADARKRAAIVKAKMASEGRCMATDSR